MSPHTVTAYEQDLSQFYQYLSTFGHPEPPAWKALHIRGWMASLLNEGLVAKSVHRKISAIRALIKHLRRNGKISHDPLAKVVLPKMPKKVVMDIPAKDLRELFLRFPWEEQKNGARDKLMLLMFYTTGVRLSELIGLRPGDVDLKRNVMQVTGKRNKQRIIPLHPELAEAIQEYQEFHQGHNYLFVTEQGEPLYPMLVYRLVTHYLQLFSTAMKTSPHVLRHSFATHLLNNGAELLAIKELLGHSSLAATQVYTKNSLDKLRNVHKLHPRS